MKGRLSTTSTALPTSSAASDAAKKLVNGIPYSSSVIQRVNRIRLKPKRKKIVGGSTCFICTSHQSKPRRHSGAGARMAVEMDGVMASFRRSRALTRPIYRRRFAPDPLRTLGGALNCLGSYQSRRMAKWNRQKPFGRIVRGECEDSEQDR